MLGVALAAAVVAAPAESGNATRDLPPFLEDFQAGQLRDLPLFLDDFFADRETPVVARAVEFPGAAGPVHGYWARPERAQPLPAALLVYDQAPWTAWMQTNARQLASIGYEVLALNVQRHRLAAAGAFTDEAALAELSAAVRWLRGRKDVLPNRLGVVGWGWSGGQALALAAALPVQACVLCDAPLPNEAGVILGLRGTPVLAVYGANAANAKELPAFNKRLAARQGVCKLHVAPQVHAGFMGPPASKEYVHDAAEDAWVEIYNFLEKYVEDARPNELPAKPASSVATIADLMRAVNEPAGLRGTLSRALEQEPKNERQWGQIRANAALIAEAGAWLQARTPPKGLAGHWQKQAQAFTAAATAIVDAADRHDYAGARQRLAKLAGQVRRRVTTEHR